MCDVDERGARDLAEADAVRGEAKPPPSAVAPAVSLAPVLSEIAAGLSAALSCWRLSVEQPSRSYARTVNELTRAEIQRVAWLVEGLQVLAEPPAVTRTRINLMALVDEVVEATRVERRLVDVTLSASLGQRAVPIRGSEPLLRLALGSWLQALVALVSQTPRCSLWSGLSGQRCISSCLKIRRSSQTCCSPTSLIASISTGPGATLPPWRWRRQDASSSFMVGRSPRSQSRALAAG